MLGIAILGKFLGYVMLFSVQVEPNFKSLSKICL